MTGEQLAKMLKRVGMSQSRLARELGMDSRTVRRWISNETPITLVHQYAIRYVLEILGLR